MSGTNENKEMPKFYQKFEYGFVFWSSVLFLMSCLKYNSNWNSNPYSLIYILSQFEE